MGEILDESLCHLPIAWRHGWGLFSLNSFCNENSMNTCLLLVLALSLFSSSSLSLGFVLGSRSRVVSAEYEDFSLFFHFFFKEKTASIWFTWNPWSTVGFFFSFFGCFLLGLSKHLGAWVLIWAGSTSSTLYHEHCLVECEESLVEWLCFVTNMKTKLFCAFRLFLSGFCLALEWWGMDASL